MPPSAFDALMTGARALAKKKQPPPSPSSSHNKRKPPSHSHSLSTPLKNPNNLKPPETLETTAEREPPKKLPRKESAIVELKDRVSFLKKNPSEFDPGSVAWWEKRKPVPFLFLSLAFDLIREENRRIAMTDIACNLFRTVIHSTPEDLVLAVYLSVRRIAPPHQGLELGIREASIDVALADASGRTKKLSKDEGELGKRLTQSMLQKPDALTIRKVFNTFRLIAKESGINSQEKKKNHMRSLLLAATDCEPLYIVGWLKNNLQIGCAEQTFLAALGQAAVYIEEHSQPPPGVQSPLEEDGLNGNICFGFKPLGWGASALKVGDGELLPKKAAKIVKQVYSVLPDYDKIVSALLKDGVWLLPKTCNFTPGVPIEPMASKVIKTVSEALNKFQDVEFTCEYKYDGERAQVHYMENGSVEIYSRNSERNTGKFPDVVAAVSRFKKTTVSSFVLDCELVAYDRAKQKILPLQVLSTRARKNVALSDIKVEVCIFAFDLLYLNGQALLQENLKIRKEHLYASFEEESGFLQFATSITSNDAEEIQKFFDKAVDASCEGLVFKTLNEDATYEPSEHSRNWLKLKKDYQDNIGDTLDLVPIGAFHGKGKRKGVYGSFLLACYDKNGGEFQTICKVGTKLSDEMLKEFSARLRSKLIPGPKADYRHANKIKPDVWFEASEVWEVKASDLTISSEYQAAVGILGSNKGISLRFPRPLRVRHDKAPQQATSSEQVAEMYNAQKNTITQDNK